MHPTQRESRRASGDVDPAGRLPVTFAPDETYPITDERRYPGVDVEAHYEEGLFVWYRHVDAVQRVPTYPFGHGHSYAAFEYGEADVELEGGRDDATARVRVTVEVENVANRSGREVVQAYVQPPGSDSNSNSADRNSDRPIRELAGFAAVELAAGESRTIELELAERAFARYDEDDGWTIDPGGYVVEVGRSSREIRTEVALER